MASTDHANPLPSDASRSAPGRVSLWGLLAWTAIALMLAAIIARVAWHDGHLLLVWTNSFTAYVYLPAYAVALVALWRCRWRLVAVALVIVACHLVMMWPDFQPASELPDRATDAPRVRLFSANLNTQNGQYAAMADEIRAANAQVLLFQEWSPSWRDALTDSGVLQDYPHKLALPQTGAFGLAIYSKTPFERQEIWSNAGLPTARVSLRLGNQTLRLYNIHSMPPRDSDKVARAHEYWRALHDELTSETEPVVLIGDFNTTQHSVWHDQLLDRGFRSAHIDRGRGHAVTWPNGRAGLIPPIRVDHCLISPEVVCLNIEEGQGFGSDHRPLVVDLALPGKAAH